MYQEKAMKLDFQSGKPKKSNLNLFNIFRMRRVKSPVNRTLAKPLVSPLGKHKRFVVKSK